MVCGRFVSSRVGRAMWLVRASEHQPRSPILKKVRLPGGKNSIQSSTGPTRNPHFYISERLALRRYWC